MAEGSGLSAGDIMALTRGNEGFLEGNGIIILILFFLIFGFNGAWGNGGNALTQSELQLGLYNQTTDRNLSDIRDGIAEVNNNILTSSCNTQKEVLQNRYDNALQTQTLSSQLSECCCNNRYEALQNTNTLIAQMNANTQAILDKMCQSEIQNLRDEVAGYRETLSNANQTQNLLNAIGTWRANPPYYSYCGAFPYGTTIA